MKTAPFAFLGPDYDPQLRAVYTETAPHQILLKRALTAALFDDAMATRNMPLSNGARSASPGAPFPP